jgi:hypothetical protein
VFATGTDNDKRLEKLYTLRAESLFYLAIRQSIIKLGFPRGLSQKTLISLDSWKTELVLVFRDSIY